MTQPLTSVHAGGLSPEAAAVFLEELYEEHGSRVYGLCRLLLRDSLEAEDAAQQIFLSAHRSILSGHAPRDAGVWLSTIARNECRARIWTRTTEPLAGVNEAERAGDDMEDIAGRREEIAALRQALNELPDSQREAVLLREIHGLSYDELSARTGLSISAVKSVLFRARRGLRSRLGSGRAAAGAASFPLALREWLGQLSVSGSGESAAAAAKALSLPVAAKLAAATASVAIVGSLGGDVAFQPRDPPRLLEARRTVPVLVAPTPPEREPATERTVARAPAHHPVTPARPKSGSPEEQLEEGEGGEEAEASEEAAEGEAEATEREVAEHEDEEARVPEDESED